MSTVDNKITNELDKLIDILNTYPKVKKPYILPNVPNKQILCVFGYIDERKNEIVYNYITHRGLIESLIYVDFNSYRTSNLYNYTPEYTKFLSCKIDNHGRKYIDTANFGGISIYYCRECVKNKDAELPLFSKEYYTCIKLGNIIYDLSELEDLFIKFKIKAEK